MCLLSISPLLVHVVLLSSHHPLIACHVSRSFHISLSPRASPLYLISCPSAYRLPPCSFPCHLPHTSSLLIPSHLWRHHPIARPILRAGLHADTSGVQAHPGGSARSLPRPKSAELAGSSSIPIKQLLRWLVVVRHRLRHYGKVRLRLKARRFAHEAVRRGGYVR
jgi:hypothetical protein